MRFSIVATNYLQGDDRIPSPMKHEFEEITKRANVLLADCNDAQLKEQVYVLQAILFQCDPDYFDPNADVEQLTDGDWNSVPNLLFRHHRSIGLNKESDLTWPQYFALLALMIRDQAWFMDMFSQEEQFPKKLKKKLPTTIGMYAMEAMAALCFGEALALSGEIISQAVKGEISERNAKAAQLRHADKSQLKNRFIKYYYSAKHKSKADAARRFYEDNHDDFKGQDKSNAVRMLLSALAMFEKKSPK